MTARVCVVIALLAGWPGMFGSTPIHPPQPVSAAIQIQAPESTPEPLEFLQEEILTLSRSV